MQIRVETVSHSFKIDVDARLWHGLMWWITTPFGWVVRVYPLLIEWSEEEATNLSDPIEYQRWVTDNASPDYWG